LNLRVPESFILKIKELEIAIDEIKPLVERLNTIIALYTDIIIIGNGGSNSVASHISQDYTKVLDKRAISFSDPSRLTCYINDYGRDEAYKEFIKDFASVTTLIILISSSGNSLNIYNAALYCKEKNIPFLSLSGFNKNNKLNNLDGSLMKYWVNSKDYGVVESAHLIFLHSIL
jgi:D-sedoheptulose 7-phosphate isomerase